MGDLSAISGILAAVMLVSIIIIVVFATILILIYRQLSLIRGLLQGNNFYLMTLVQTLGERKAAVRAAMHHFKLKENEALQFLQLIQMHFPEDEEEHD